MSYTQSERHYIKGQQYKSITEKRNIPTSKTSEEYGKIKGQRGSKTVAMKNYSNSENKSIEHEVYSSARKIKEFSVGKLDMIDKESKLNPSPNKNRDQKIKNPSKIETKTNRRHSFNGYTIDISLNDSNTSSPHSLGSDLSKNSVEKGLRKYYHNNGPHFKERVSKGPPETFRWLSWLITSGLPFDRSFSVYSSLLEKEVDKETDIQINKDISRTLREHSFNCEEIQTMLYRILKALALLDQELSYCQGMNFISGFMLIASDFNELETVYLLVSLFSNNSPRYGLRNFFTGGFPLLMFYLNTFNCYFAKRLPKVHSHFKQIEIPDDCWVSKWYQTLFTQSLTYEANLRLFDLLFVHGLFFLIPFTLSLINHLKVSLMQTNDLIEVTEYFKRLNAYHYKLNEKLQVNYDIEKILNDARNKFWISEEEITNLCKVYFKEEIQSDKLLIQSNKITYLKYTLEDEYKINNSYSNMSYNSKASQQDKIENKFSKFVPYILSESKLSQDNVNKNCITNATTTIFKHDNSKISDLDSQEMSIEYDDELLTTEPGIAENTYILEQIDKNEIRFRNPFVKK